MKARPKNLKALKALIDDSKIEWKDDKLSGLERATRGVEKNRIVTFSKTMCQQEQERNQEKPKNLNHSPRNKHYALDKDFSKI